MGADLATGPWWLVAACAAAGLGVGWWLARALGGAAYRIDEECEAALPRGGWAIAPATGLVWALLAWRLGGLGGGVVLPALLLLATAGVALWWIDVDVHRLPEGLTFPTAALVAALLVLAAALTGDWGALVRAVIGGVAAYLGVFVLALISRGQFGLGDVTLSGLLGLALAYLGAALPLWAILLAFVLSSVFSIGGMILGRLSRRSAIPFGPFLLLGALLVALAPGATR